MHGFYEEKMTMWTIRARLQQLPHHIIRVMTLLRLQMEQRTQGVVSRRPRQSYKAKQWCNQSISWSLLMMIIPVKLSSISIHCAFHLHSQILYIDTGDKASEVSCLQAQWQYTLARSIYQFGLYHKLNKMIRGFFWAIPPLLCLIPSDLGSYAG